MKCWPFFLLFSSGNDLASNGIEIKMLPERMASIQYKTNLVISGSSFPIINNRSSLTGQNIQKYVNYTTFLNNRIIKIVRSVPIFIMVFHRILDYTGVGSLSCPFLIKPGNREPGKK